MYVPFYLFCGCKSIFVVSFFCIDLLYLFLHNELGIHWCSDFFSVSVMSSGYSDHEFLSLWSTYAGMVLVSLSLAKY
jgi:hypothetical protein